MAGNLANVDKGMVVYDSGGDKVGTIESIHRDPEAQSGMEAYQEARMANVGTDDVSDDADAEAYTTAGGGNDSSGAGWDGESTVGLANQGGGLAGTGAAPGTPAFSGTGNTSGANARTDEASDFGGPLPADAGVDLGGYIQVKEGGILGIGGKDLYVPMDVVESVAPGDSVTLACSKQEAESQFASAPEGLHENA
ncbi:MAG: hypothetical protein ACR2JC_07820 [Chloroflexota bacterium]